MRDGDARATGAAGRQRELSAKTREAISTRLRVVAEPTRIQLMQLLDRYPNATPQELSDLIATSYNNVIKHLTVLYFALQPEESRAFLR